ncbi:unnamed protein product [Owenia fusiformis]|uniref:CWH43-like N-terminal domain-containing protein n=1 Tax=Owenia fusiformis TaxID=6347 RepID=A0A8S4P3L6_OWEFU|nr:unnamed protein product [Owenia fusiformis]
MVWGRSLYGFPLAIPIILCLTFIVTYVVSVQLGHVNPSFPFISDTGSRPPESCIFGQMLNIAAVLVAIVMYIRYRQVLQYSSQETGIVLKLNTVSLYLGFIAAFGLSVVGNFQESNALVVHLIGALLAFGLGTVYCCLQTIMSFKMHPHMNSRVLSYIRLIFSLIAVLAFIFMFAVIPLAFQKGESKDNLMPRGTARNISVTSEWLLAAAVMCFFFTFVGEFRKIRLSAPEMSLRMESLAIVDYQQNQGNITSLSRNHNAMELGAEYNKSVDNNNAEVKVVGTYQSYNQGQ